VTSVVGAEALVHWRLLTTPCIDNLEQAMQCENSYFAPIRLPILTQIDPQHPLNRLYAGQLPA
jgi:hypothetical protein